MATSKDSLPEERERTPPPSYDSLVTQWGVKGNSENPESGFTYPPGYSTLPLTQSHFQPTAQQTGQQQNYIPGAQYCYPPQLPQATVSPPCTASSDVAASLTPNRPAVNYVIVNQPVVAGTVGVQTCGGQQRGGRGKPPNYMCFSLVTCLCFNGMFGLLALAFSCHSDSAYAAGDNEKARQYGRYAFFINIIGIILTAMFTFCVMILS